ncbi:MULTISPECIES: FUSC family protein [unclassified Streptomyces]|uniref:FUSC family protein n=1 Tax=unclassified Streptomyces TaxID=2593676 RepID=UPI000B8123E0|nr:MULTISPECIES: FUSC family protein [unclassified Streptomyces]MYS24985.1 FUSC family protein [Streptomyces sp. SID4948]
MLPPRWLLDTVRPRPAPVPWAAVARAAVALGAPLAVGIAAGRLEYAVLVDIGAVFAVLCDSADPYRLRVVNIAVPQPFGVAGVALGILVRDRGWVAVLTLTLVALVSGMISSIGSVASYCGLLLLLNTVLGAGVAFPEPRWTAPLLFALGGAFVLALTLAGWPLRRGAPERDAVARSYRAVADLLEAAGKEDYDVRRHAVTMSMNQAYDGILSRRVRDIGDRSPRLRLLAQLNAVTPVVEAAAAARLLDRGADPAVPAMVRDLAGAIAEGRGARRPGPLPVAGTPAERAVNTALRHAAKVVGENSPLSDDAADLLGRPTALRLRARRAAADVLLSEASWRYGVRLALCIGIAQTLVSVAALPRSYWIAVTVTYVLKPDFGSVFSRAVTRAIGTVLGLVVAAAVVSNVARGWWDVPVMAVLAGLVPAVSAKGYGFQTASITPVVLLLTDLLSHQGVDLVLQRFIDSLIGCGIVLVVGYLLWPESWRARIGDRLADTVDDAAEYLLSAFGPGVLSDDAEAARARMRRRVYRALSVVRSEFQRALAEPPPTGPRATAWLPLVVAVERIVDATTAARVRVTYGAPAPDLAEVAEIEAQLRRLAAQVRTPQPPAPGPAPGPGGGAEQGALADLWQEVEAAHAIASTGPGG